jgi:hypothetical protein
MTIVASPWIWSSHMCVGWEAIATYRALSDTGIQVTKSAVRWQTLHSSGTTALTHQCFIWRSVHVRKQLYVNGSACVHVHILPRPLQYLLTLVAHHKRDLFLYRLINYSSLEAAWWPTQGQGTLRFSRQSRPAPDPTQLYTQSVPRDLTAEVMWGGCKADYSPSSKIEFGMKGVLPPLSQTLSWRADEKFYV